MKLTPKQKEILNCEKRFICVVSGRRGGKSYSAIASLAKHARYPNSTCLYVAPTHGMCRQVLWKPLKELMLAKKWAKKINESNLEITLINNSIIMLRSADTPDRLRGLSLTHCVIDEASDISAETWSMVIRPALADQQGSALIITTPKAKGWVYDVFENAKTLNDWYSMSYTTAEGGLVSEEEIAQAKLDMDERTFKQEFLAEWVDFEGQIYYAFGDHNIQEKPIIQEARTPLHVGGDFNWSPLVAVIGQQTQEGIHIFDEIQLHGSDTGEMAKEIQQRYPGRKIIFYPDSSGKAHKTSALGGVTDHIILKNAGFELRVGSTNPAVKDRIASVNSVCKKDNCRLTIDPKCKHIIEGLRKHVYQEGTRQPEKNNGATDYSHFNDALGYLVNWLYPLKTNIQNNQGKIRRATGGHYR